MAVVPMQADTTAVARYNPSGHSAKLHVQKIGFCLVKSCLMGTTSSDSQIERTVEAKNTGFDQSEEKKIRANSATGFCLVETSALACTVRWSWVSACEV